jgi:hypothetical protein
MAGQNKLDAIRADVSSGNAAQYPIGLLPAVTVPGLRGNEVTLSYFLGEIIGKVAPHWKVVSPQEIIARVNRQRLAPDYMRMRSDYDENNIFDRDQLHKIASAIGVRYVFQPRLAAFSQMMTDRFKFPAFGVLLSQTRSSNMRLLVQLWDTESGELVWASLAETTMQNEAVSQDPVYLEDITRATVASILADLLNGRNISKYTPVDKFIDDLITEAVPKQTSDSRHISTPGPK